MKINIHGAYYRFELYEDNGGHRHLFAFLGDDYAPIAGFCGTYNETADAIRDMLSDDPMSPEDWEGQYDNGVFGEIEDDRDRDDLETVDYVRTAYEEIIDLESHRNGGAWQII